MSNNLICEQISKKKWIDQSVDFTKKNLICWMS